MTYYLRKIGFYAIATWIAITLNFLLPRLIKGDPVDVLLTKLSKKSPVPPEARRALELQFGSSDDPLFVQYFGYIGNLFTGNWGVSVTYYPTPVTEVIAGALPWTIGLVGLSTIISYVIGLLVGSWIGWKRGTWVDALLPASTFVSAIPYFWVAMVFIYVFAITLRWLPVGYGYSLSIYPGWNLQFIGSVITHGFMPALTIIIVSVCGSLLAQRNMMVSTMSEDYVVTARAKGLRPSRVFGSYAMRNALLPGVAGFALSLGFIVNGSIITESVFAYPGLGFTLLQAVDNSDYPLMQSLFLVITLSVLAANFLVDIVYASIDPRTRIAD